MELCVQRIAWGQENRMEFCVQRIAWGQENCGRIYRRRNLEPRTGDAERQRTSWVSRIRRKLSDVVRERERDVSRSVSRSLRRPVGRRRLLVTQMRTDDLEKTRT